VLDPITELYDDTKRKCLLRLEYENQSKCEAITSSSSKFYQKPAEYAMWKYAYYVCFKCKKVIIPIVMLLLFILCLADRPIMVERLTVPNRLLLVMTMTHQNSSVHPVPMWTVLFRYSSISIIH